MNPQIIEQMRQWVAEVVWNGECADWVAVMPQQSIIECVGRHYDGGVEQFLSDCRPPEVVLVVVRACEAEQQSGSVEVPVRVIVQDELLLNPEDLR